MDVAHLLPLFIAGLLIGLSLCSIPAAGHLVFPLLVIFFDNPLLASGTLLPILIIGDISTLCIYRKHFDSKFFISIIPSVIIGLIIGAIALGDLQNPIYFRKVIAVLLLIPIIILILENRLKNWVWQKKKGALSITGFFMSFFACIGHMGGAVASTFLMGKTKDKRKFIASYSSLFLLINVLKMPIYHHYDMINLLTIEWAGLTSIFVLIGSVIGFLVIKSVPQKAFEKAMIVFILISCIISFFR